MKMTLLTIIIAGLLAACTAAPVKEQPVATPAVTRSAPTSPPPTESKVTSRPAPAAVVPADPLNDPHGVLAKRSIYFTFDRFEIADEYKPLIQAHARYLIGHRTTRIKIEGHCDERGSREYNIALGQKRADSVKSALRILGVGDDQIETLSWGEEKPADPGHDEQAWSKNRRGDLVYAGTR
jgi:peptidoglycan-associated lipoprotein